MTDRSELKSSRQNVKQRNFLFLACNGETGRSNDTTKPLVKRHVQIDFRSRSQSSDSVPRRKAQSTRPKSKSHSPKTPCSDTSHLPTASVKSPDNLAAWRQGLQGRFVELYICKDKAITATGPVSLLRNDNRPSTTLALDSLCLVVVGSTLTNGAAQDMYRQAQETYSLALTHFRKEIVAFHAGQVSPQWLLEPVHYLRLCEIFSAIAITDQGWEQHTVGLQSLMHNCLARKNGPIKLRLALEGLVGLRLPFALWNGLLNHTPVTIDYGMLMSVANLGGLSGLPEEYWRQLYDVPTLLERSDDVRKKGLGATVAEVAATLDEFRTSEREVMKQESVVRPVNQAQDRYTVPVQALWDPMTECFIDPSIFPSANIFTGVPDLLRSIYHWMCLLALRQAYIEFLSAYPRSATETIVERLTKDAYDNADNLCMSLPYMGMPKNGYIGLISAMAPLELARRWYVSQGDTAKTAWCDSAGTGLQKRGLVTLSHERR